MDLGANEWTTFWKVTFPLILPGVLAAALLAFSLSIDDFVITNFTAGGTVTFPMFIYAQARIGIPPQVNVIGTIIFLTAVGLVALSHARSRAGGRCATRRSPASTPSKAPEEPIMVDTAPNRPSPDATAPLPTSRPRRRARGLEPDHEPRRRPRRGVVADHPRRRALPRLLVGDRRHQHRPRPSAGRGGDRGAGGEALHGQQNIVYHEPGLRLYERLPARAARRSVAGLPVELGRRGGRGLGQARAGRDRPAGDPRVPLRLPRPDGPDDGAHDRQGRLPRRVRAAPRLGLPHGLPVLLPRARRRPRARCLHVRLGGPARPDLPPVHLPGPGRGGHHRAGPRRGRLHRAAAGLPAAAARDHPPARHPAHRRRGPDRVRADRRDVRGPALGRRARHPGHGQGHRLRAATLRDPGTAGADGRLEARHPRRDVRRQRRRRAPRPTRRSTSSRTRGWSPTPASAGRSSWPGFASSPGATRRSATPAASG